MEISEDDVYGMDWDWFASDRDGHVAHFTTAGMRPLPESVRSSREQLEQLSSYFTDRAPIRGSALLTPGLDRRRGAFNKPVNWSCFLHMAARGLYSYNTELIHSADAEYYLVATPDQPLALDDLPEGVRYAVRRTVLSISFATATRIAEAQML